MISIYHINFKEIQLFRLAETQILICFTSIRGHNTGQNWSKISFLNSNCILFVVIHHINFTEIHTFKLYILSANQKLQFFKSLRGHNFCHKWSQPVFYWWSKTYKFQLTRIILKNLSYLEKPWVFRTDGLTWKHYRFPQTQFIGDMKCRNK